MAVRHRPQGRAERTLSAAGRFLRKIPLNKIPVGPAVVAVGIGLAGWGGWSILPDSETPASPEVAALPVVGTVQWDGKSDALIVPQRTVVGASDHFLANDTLTRIPARTVLHTTGLSEGGDQYIVHAPGGLTGYIHKDFTMDIRLFETPELRIIASTSGQDVTATYNPLGPKIDDLELQPGTIVTVTGLAKLWNEKALVTMPGDLEMMVAARNVLPAADWLAPECLGGDAVRNDCSTVTAASDFARWDGGVDASVLASDAQLRTSPASRAPVIGTLAQGTMLPDFTATLPNGWRGIKMPTGKTAWMDTPESFDVQAVAGEQVTLTARGARDESITVQAGPQDETEITSLDAGTRLTRIGMSGDHSAVRLADGSIGWIASNRLLDEAQRARINAVRQHVAGMEAGYASWPRGETITVSSGEARVTDTASDDAITLATLPPGTAVQVQDGTAEEAGPVRVSIGEGFEGWVDGASLRRVTVLPEPVDLAYMPAASDEANHTGHLHRADGSTLELVPGTILRGLAVFGDGESTLVRNLDGIEGTVNRGLVPLDETLAPAECKSTPADRLRACAASVLGDEIPVAGDDAAHVIDVTADRFLLARPQPDAPLIGMIQGGTSLAGTGREIGDYTEVKLGNDRTGWVQVRAAFGDDMRCLAYFNSFRDSEFHYLHDGVWSGDYVSAHLQEIDGHFLDIASATDRVGDTWYRVITSEGIEGYMEEGVVHRLPVPLENCQPNLEQLHKRRAAGVTSTGPALP